VIDACRACGGTQLDQVLTLGPQRLSDFRTDPSPSPAYPLNLLFCHGCLLVQLSETVPRDQLYTPAYGFYSGVNEGIRRDLRATVDLALGYRPDAAAWLDIACNDGTLLCQVPPRIRRVGVDPVAKFKALAEQCADEVVSDFFTPDAFGPGAAFNVITASSVFYDLDDPGQFVADVKRVLAPYGVWVIQQNYLGAMLANLSLDNVCHEHITYFSLASLSRLMRAHGMEVVEAHRSEVNGGSFRTVVMDQRSRPSVDVSVPQLLAAEGQAGLSQVTTYHRFRDRALGELRKLRHLLDHINAAGERCYLYAASTRGATLWQTIGLTGVDCRYAVERNPAKVGLWFSPVQGCKIISEEQGRADRPEFMLVGPWWFEEQIVERERRYLADGGRLIFPLPRFKVVGKAGREVSVRIE
jgi:NDP-4-keto-2,6-dideoxyhexose 3-C-methyltransferase